MSVKKEPKSPFIHCTRTQDDESFSFTNINTEETIKRWIKTGSLISIIKERCRVLREESKESVIFEFTIPVNIMELLDFDAFIGNIAIKETKNFILTIQKVIFEIVEEQSWLRVSQQSQILVFLEISNLPAFSDNNNTERGVNTRIPTKEKLVKIEGTVVSLTPLLKYTKGAKYNCPQEGCPTSTGNGKILVWHPGSSESTLVRSDYTCDFCGSYLQEDVSCRRIGEKQIAKVILNNGLTCMEPCSGTRFSRQQAMTITLRGEMVSRLSFGVNYWITGFVVKESSSRTQHQSHFNISIEAFNIEEVQTSVISKFNPDEEVPVSIKTLCKDRSASPWSFVASLAYCFGESICISGYYNRLKMSLMLSLVMLGDHVLIEDIDGRLAIDKEDLTSINMLACAEDILVIQRLFSYASSFADKAVQATPCIALGGEATQHASGGFFVDAGGLLLSGKHLCNIPNLSAMKKDDVERLEKALETNAVVFNIPKRVADQTEFIQMSFPLQATVWASAEISSTEKNSFIKWNTLIEHFDLVYNFNGNCAASDEIEEDNAKEILRNAMGVKKDPEIGYEDMKKFIKFVRARRVNFSETASNMLRSFFLASRRARDSGISRVEISKRSLQTLLSIAAAHAKLSLRNQVLPEDALMAILIYEESLTTRVGYSVIEIQPKLHFSRQNFAANLGPKNDEWMMMFHTRINDFCKTYSSGINSGLYRTEE
eukprot:gene375-1008_t